MKTIYPPERRNGIPPKSALAASIPVDVQVRYTAAEDTSTVP